LIVARAKLRGIDLGLDGDCETPDSVPIDAAHAPPWIAGLYRPGAVHGQ
jgi:hypothetical protein